VVLWLGCLSAESDLKIFGIVRKEGGTPSTWDRRLEFDVLRTFPYTLRHIVPETHISFSST
jgi:hypothetical protein